MKITELLFKPIEIDDDSFSIKINGRKIKGDFGETLFELEMLLNNCFYERTGVGSDYKFHQQDLMGRKVGKTKYAEVKFGKSHLTDRQRVEKTKRGSQYVVRRFGWL